MKNKTKIIVGALVALIVILLLVFILTKKDDVPSIGNDVVTPTLSLEVTKIPHSILTSTPKVDEEIIPTAPIISDDKNDKNDTTIKDDIPNFDDGQEATPTPSVSEVPKASPTPQVSETPKATSTPIPTQKVEVTPTSIPTPTSTPKPTSTPIPTKAPSANGKVELESLGISVPKRDEFNEVALKKDKAWWGDVDDTKSGQALGDTLDSIFYALEDKGIVYSGTQAFLLQDSQISWDWASFSGNHDFSLVRDTTNGEYVLEINNPLDEDIFFGRDLAPYNRDIVKVLVSCFSSEVEEVYFEVFDSIYGDNDISIPMYPSWATIGDCQASFDYEASYNNHFVFKFKPN